MFQERNTELIQKTADNADAPSARNASLSSLRSDLLRKPFSLAQGSSKLSPFAAALALLFDLENNVGSSKAAATAGFAEGKTATSCASVSEHQRYLRSFLMGLELWKYIVIQFRSKARKKKFNRGSVSVSSRNLSCRRRGQQGRPPQNQRQ